MRLYTTSQRLRQIMDSRNLRQIDILRQAEPYCEKYGVKLAKNDLSQYVSGKVEPGQDKLTILGLALNVSETWLMGYDVDPIRSDPAEKQSNTITIPPGMSLYKPGGSMPILGRVAAGQPLFAEENIEDYVANDFTDGEIYYSLRVDGDSMTAAGIDPGDLVIVRQQSTVDEGQIAVVLVNGDNATIKYFQQRGNLVILSPKSFNPIHQNQLYNIKETPVRIIGRVVEIRKRR